jgi:2-dehydropantoate 2-reductase
MTERGSVAVVGVGAVGGVVAAELTCVREPFDRIVIAASDGTREATCAVVTDPGQTAPASWVLVATKAHQTAGAAPWLAALVGRTTRVAVLQNGVEHSSTVPLPAPRRGASPCAGPRASSFGTTKAVAASPGSSTGLGSASRSPATS